MAQQWDKPGDTGKKDETGKQGGDIGKQGGDVGKQGGEMPREGDKGFPEKKKDGDLPR